MHLTGEQISQLKNGQLSNAENEFAMRHLEECIDCQEAFLILVSDEEIMQAEQALAPGFTERVLAKTHGSEKSRKKPVPIKSPEVSGNKWLAYYVAAAAVTLILMSGGYFQGLVNTVPRFDNGLSLLRHTEEKRNLDWGGKVTAMTASWLDSFEAVEKGGSSHEQKK